MKTRTRKGKARRRNRTQSVAFKSNGLHCATCGTILRLTFVQAGGEFFCSGIHAEEFFHGLDRESVKLEPGNGLHGGSFESGGLRG